MGVRDLRAVGPEDPSGPVTVGVVFDRFPASVRGAVVVKALDSEPHQVRVTGAEVVYAHSLKRSVRPVSLEYATVDVAPHGDVLIPFDIPFSGLPPGWYAVAAEVLVDGAHRIRGPEGGGKRFAVPWPPEEVRRGEVKAGLDIDVRTGAAVDKVECKPDRAVVRWHLRPGHEAEFGELKVTADRRRLPVVESSYDPKSGVRTTMVHPVPRRAKRLTFELDRPGGRRGTWSASLDLS